MKRIEAALLGRGWLLWVALGAYYVLLGTERLAPPAAPWIQPALTLLLGVIVVLGVGGTAWSRYRMGGVERQVLLEATCVAFLVTLVAGVFLDAPWTYDVGVAAWFVTSAVRMRQLA